MNIAVLIKQVPVSNKVSVDPETHALIRSSSEGMINPSDRNGIEAALRIRDAYGGKVVVFTMGPPQAESSLREAMGIGCDEACLVSDRVFGRSDTLATARVLAAAIRAVGSFDLVCCGSLSADGATGQVAAMLAEDLGWAQAVEVHGVKDVDGEQHSIRVSKDLGKKSYLLEIQLPAVLTFQFGCNEPRLATLRSARNAKNKPLKILSNKELKLSEDRVGAAGSPSLVVDSWSAAPAGMAEMIEGTPQELAAKLRRMIAKEREK